MVYPRHNLPILLYPHVLEHLDYRDIATLSGVNVQIRKSGLIELTGTARQDISEIRGKQTRLNQINQVLPAHKAAEFKELRKKMPRAVIAVDDAIVAAARVSALLRLTAPNLQARSKNVEMMRDQQVRG